MKVFEEVWPKLCALREAVLSLRPVIDSGLKQGETKEQRNEERGERFIKAFMALATTVEHCRLFYPPTIWNELRTVLDFSCGEGMDFRSVDRRGHDWEKAIENAKAINEQVDKTCDAIRLDLRRLTRPNHHAAVTS
jgi:hypothetical protein